MWHLLAAQLRQRRWQKNCTHHAQEGEAKGARKGGLRAKRGGATKVRKRGYTPHLVAREPPFRTLFAPPVSRVGPLFAPFLLLFRTHYSGSFMLLYCDLQWFLYFSTMVHPGLGLTTGRGGGEVNWETHPPRIFGRPTHPEMAYPQGEGGWLHSADPPSQAKNLGNHYVGYWVLGTVYTKLYNQRIMADQQGLRLVTAIPIMEQCGHRIKTGREPPCIKKPLCRLKQKKIRRLWRGVPQPSHPEMAYPHRGGGGRSWDIQPPRNCLGTTKPPPTP